MVPALSRPPRLGGTGAEGSPHEFIDVVLVCYFFQHRRLALAGESVEGEGDTTSASAFYVHWQYWIHSRWHMRARLDYFHRPHAGRLISRHGRGHQLKPSIVFSFAASSLMLPPLDCSFLS